MAAAMHVCTPEFLSSLCNLQYVDAVSWVQKLQRTYNWRGMIVLVREPPEESTMDTNCIYAVRPRYNTANKVGIASIWYKEAIDATLIYIHRSDTTTFKKFLTSLESMHINEASLAVSRTYPDIWLRCFYSQSKPSIHENHLHLFQFDSEVTLRTLRYLTNQGDYIYK